MPEDRNRAAREILAGMAMVFVRTATAEDAAGIREVWLDITAQHAYSAVDEPWDIEQERA